MKNQSSVLDDQSCILYPPAGIFPERLLHSIIDVICTIDKKGFFRYVSPACTRLFLYEPEEMSGQSFLQFIFPEDVEKTRMQFDNRTHDCCIYHFENRYIRKDGQVVPVIWSARWDEEEEMLYCVARDGSEKKVIEQRLEKAQQMARLINFEYDELNDCYNYSSDLFYEICGIDRAEHPVITSALFWSLVHPDDRARVKCLFKDILSKNQLCVEYRMIRPDGAVIHVNHLREFVLDDSGQHVRTVGTIQDITYHKQAEVAIHQSERRFRSLVEKSSDLIAILNEEGVFQYVTDSHFHLLGYEFNDLVGKVAFEFIHEEDRQRLLEHMAEVLTHKHTTTNAFRFLRKNGEWCWLETRATNFLYDPAVAGIVVNSRDITESRQAKARLELSEQKFKSLVRFGSDIIVILDEEARFKYVSDNVHAILGYDPMQLAGQHVFDFLHPEDYAIVAEELQKVIVNTQNSIGTIHRIRKADGSWMWLESKGINHLDNPAIMGVVINSRDITDRVNLQKKLDEELINKQKEITAAVIKAQETERSQLGLELHDNVNQVLTTVKLYNEMYLTGYVEDKALLEKSAIYLQECINEIRSISKRLSAPTLGNISLHDSIRELVESINLTNRIEIEYRTDGIKGCDVSQDLHLAIYRIIQEALNNIIKYAEARTASIIISRKSKGLSVSITDDGRGFEPGLKTGGIGLTNMRTRTENLNGQFSISSAPCSGCRIEIEFPLDEADAEE